MTGATLRPATAADAADLARIMAAARLSADIPNLHTAVEDLAFHRRLIAEARVMVALNDGVPVGYAAVRDGWLEHLWIAPEHHRRGIGRKLLAWARTSHPGDLDLYVFTHNTRAIAFYLAHGAVQIDGSDGQGNEEHLPDLTFRLARA
ncbi:MAG: GNAT family N-acetyltransferase [Alphaproteobacteria bacterium]|nr:GNAT family N-acetyltransferase [Alphaproteobacteria bacterium]